MHQRLIIKKDNFSIKLEIAFSKISIKGRSSIGNIVTKTSVKRVDLKESGISTLQARKIWYDTSVNRLNVDNRGEYIGEFSSDDRIVTINQKGVMEFKSYELINHFSDDLILIEKYDPEKVISIIYFDGAKKLFYLKRFKAEIVSKPTLLFNVKKDLPFQALEKIKEKKLNLLGLITNSKVKSENELIANSYAYAGYGNNKNPLSAYINNDQIIEGDKSEVDLNENKLISKIKDFSKKYLNKLTSWLDK